MVHQKPLLVTFVVLVDRIPMPAPPKKRGRGRPKVYPDRLIVKALIIMVVRRLYSAYSLLAFLEQDTALTYQLRTLLTNEKGRFFEWGGQVPVKGLKRAQLIVLGAVLLYQLVLLYQFEHSKSLAQGIKPLLRAA